MDISIGGKLMVVKVVDQRHPLRTRLPETARNGQGQASMERRRSATPCYVLKRRYVAMLPMREWCHVRGITTARADFRCPLPRNHGLLIPLVTGICQVRVSLRRGVDARGVGFSSDLLSGEGRVSMLNVRCHQTLSASSSSAPPPWRAVTSSRPQRRRSHREGHRLPVTVRWAR